MASYDAASTICQAYCPPRHPTYCELSTLKSNVIVCRYLADNARHVIEIITNPRCFSETASYDAVSSISLALPPGSASRTPEEIASADAETTALLAQTTPFLTAASPEQLRALVIRYNRQLREQARLAEEAGTATLRLLTVFSYYTPAHSRHPPPRPDTVSSECLLIIYPRTRAASLAPVRAS